VPQPGRDHEFLRKAGLLCDVGVNRRVKYLDGDLSAQIVVVRQKNLAVPPLPISSTRA